MVNKSLIVGGAGTLGKAVVNVFKNKGWQVVSMDFVNHDKADANVLLNSQDKIAT